MKEEFKDHSHICKITYRDNFVADVWENIKEVVTDSDYIRITTHTGKKTWVQIDIIQRLTISPCPGKNFVGDYGMGFDTAKEDIMKFAQDQQEKMKPHLYKQWEEGYWAGMTDIIEHIERM